MTVPEFFYQFPVGNLLGVKIQLNRFGVITNIAIGGVFAYASGITDPGPYYPFQGTKGCIRAPESA